MSENEFEDWCNKLIQPILSSSLPSDDRETLIKYIKSIQKTELLPKEISEKTDFFLDTFSPKLISAIMQKHVKKDDAESINEIVQLYIPIFSNFLTNPEKKIVLIMKDVFVNKKLPFYVATTSIMSSPYYSDNLKKLEDTDFLSQAITLFKESQVKPKTFYWVFDIVKQLDNASKSDLTEFATHANEILLSFFESKEDEIIREIDIAKDKKIFKFLSKYTKSFKESKINSDDLYWSVLIKLATCSMLKKQFDSLNELMEIATKDKEGRKYIAESSLFSTMMSKEIHVQLVDPFTELLCVLFKHKLLEENSIIQLWEKYSSQAPASIQSYTNAFNDLYTFLPDIYITLKILNYLYET